MNDTDKTVLSDMARTHVEGVERLMTENNDLKAKVASLTTQLTYATARGDNTTEALDLTRRQLQFYQNFGVSLAAKLDAIMAVCADSVEAARKMAGAPPLEPLSADDEAKLKDLSSHLTTERVQTDPNGSHEELTK